MIRAADIRSTLRERGWMVLPRGARPEHESLDPWSFVEGLVGERPSMVERQPVRPIEGGRSFASTRGFTPLHTDSQDFLGAPPSLQVMLCRAAADRGGETRLLDTWQLVASLEKTDPALHRALFAESRTIPFYFGVVVGPTIAEKAGALVFTASPIPSPPEDRVGIALSRLFEEAAAAGAVEEIRVEQGETLLVDNHRMLHGRRAFEGDAREFLRLLAWLPTPLSNPQPLRRLARTLPPAWRAPLEEGGRHRAAVVIEMLTGVPPAKLAAREGIEESELYRWRSEAFAAAARALQRK